MDRPRFQTREVHAGLRDRPHRAVNQPIVTATTFEYETVTDLGGPYRYGRMASPTRDELEAIVADLEGATHALAFASGMAAIDSVFALLDPGDHVVAGETLYAETHDLLTDHYPTYGIDVTQVDARDAAVIADAARDETRLIYLETPSNPVLDVADIEAAARIAHGVDAHLVVDNTFASPALQRPLELGADLVVESLTKYIGGHSDAIIGAVALDDDELADRLQTLQYTRGAIPGALECFLAVRGSRTLSRRVDVQCANARAVAERLQASDLAEVVYYPGLPDHPNHDVAARQMADFGAMVSVELVGGTEAAVAFVEALDVFVLAESLGAVESLVEVPSLMTHQDLSTEARKDAGIDDGLVRLSVGTEHEDDLVADIERGLEAVTDVIGDE